jgi:hypothetical protein
MARHIAEQTRAEIENEKAMLDLEVKQMVCEGLFYLFYICLNISVATTQNRNGK